MKPYREHLKSACEECGFTPADRRQLDIHHRDGDHGNNDPANLQTLCANCHRLVPHETKRRPGRPRKYPEGSRVVTHLRIPKVLHAHLRAYADLRRESMADTIVFILRKEMQTYGALHEDETRPARKNRSEELAAQA